MMGQYNRDISRRKALRKRRITKEVYCYSNHDWEYYDNLHQFSKNKIHCSCPNCSTKTRNKGRRDKKNYDRSINYKKSDLNKQISMDAQMFEYDGTDTHRKFRHF